MNRRTAPRCSPQTARREGGCGHSTGPRDDDRSYFSSRPSRCRFRSGSRSVLPRHCRACAEWGAAAGRGAAVREKIAPGWRRYAPLRAEFGLCCVEQLPVVVGSGRYRGVARVAGRGCRGRTASRSAPAPDPRRARAARDARTRERRHRQRASWRGRRPGFALDRCRSRLRAPGPVFAQAPRIGPVPATPGGGFRAYLIAQEFAPGPSPTAKTGLSIATGLATFSRSSFSTWITSSE